MTKQKTNLTSQVKGAQVEELTPVTIGQFFATTKEFNKVNKKELKGIKEDNKAVILETVQETLKGIINQSAESFKEHTQALNMLKLFKERQAEYLTSACKKIDNMEQASKEEKEQLKEIIRKWVGAYGYSLRTNNKELNESLEKELNNATNKGLFLGVTVTTEQAKDLHKIAYDKSKKGYDLANLTSALDSITPNEQVNATVTNFEKGFKNITVLKNIHGLSMFEVQDALQKLDPKAYDKVKKNHGDWFAYVGALGKLKKRIVILEDSEVQLLNKLNIKF